MRLKALLIIVAASLAGCAGQWTRVDEQALNHKGDHYEVTLPAGWVKVEYGDMLIVTRDGPDLQKITLRGVALDKAFPALEKGADQKQLPSELAELFVADMRKNDPDQIPSLEILANEPVSIAGHDGYRIHVAYQTADGVRYQLIGYGFATDKAFYSAAYNAPYLHYFERDKARIAEVVGTLKPI